MRVNIYIADDLRRRMDRAKPPLKWSQIAAAAFEAALNEVDEKPKGAALQRLKAAHAEMAKILKEM